MAEPTNEAPCRCTECFTIHVEFISAFGKWPNKTHDESQAIKRRREDNEWSWRKVVGSG